MHGMQEKELFHDKEQADHPRSLGVQEILSVLPKAHFASGDQVMSLALGLVRDQATGQ